MKLPCHGDLRCGNTTETVQTDSLQIVAKAIPKKSGIYICVTFHAQHPSTPLCTHIVTHLFVLGRVSDWLGPEFFDDVRSIEIGCPVRVLRPEDTAKFRNGYENSNMGESRIV